MVAIPTTGRLIEGRYLSPQMGIEPEGATAERRSSSVGFSDGISARSAETPDVTIAPADVGHAPASQRPVPGAPALPPTGKERAHDQAQNAARSSGYDGGIDAAGRGTGERLGLRLGPEDDGAALDRLEAAPCVFCRDTGLQFNWFLTEGKWIEAELSCSCCRAAA